MVEHGHQPHPPHTADLASDAPGEPNAVADDRTGPRAARCRAPAHHDRAQVRPATHDALQYEQADGVIYVASARGAVADWFRNAQADPHVTVQIKDRRIDGLAEPVVAPDRIADFLQLRLARHPVMMRLMLTVEGVPPWASRAALERIAAKKALLAIRPLAD